MIVALLQQTLKGCSIFATRFKIKKNVVFTQKSCWDGDVETCSASIFLLILCHGLNFIQDVLSLVFVVVFEFLISKEKQ